MTCARRCPAWASGWRTPGRRRGPPPTTSARWTRAKAEVEALLGTFAALLRIAEVEAGAQRAGVPPVDLSAIVATVAEAFAPSAEEEGTRLVADVAPGIAVHGDRELLTQMLVNLVENALRHTPPGTQVRLLLGCRAGRAVLTVEDNGPGVPETEREQVLRRFYRLDHSRSTPGSGLGLSLVAAVAELHGAELRLEDARPGLRVSVTLNLSRVRGRGRGRVAHEGEGDRVAPKQSAPEATAACRPDHPHPRRWRVSTPTPGGSLRGAGEVLARAARRGSRSARLTVPRPAPIQRRPISAGTLCHAHTQQPESSQGPRQELPRGAPARPRLCDQQEKPADEVPPGLIAAAGILYIARARLHRSRHRLTPEGSAPVAATPRRGAICFAFASRNGRRLGILQQIQWLGGHGASIRRGHCRWRRCWAVPFAGVVAAAGAVEQSGSCRH